MQPAFSANRFITDGGVEGFPFDNHVETGTKFLVTSSQYDKANRVAFWSEHLGGKDSGGQAADVHGCTGQASELNMNWATHTIPLR